MNKIKKGGVITPEMLKECFSKSSLLYYFKENYPDGFKITLKNLKQVGFMEFQHLLWMYDYDLWSKWNNSVKFDAFDARNPKAIESLWRLL